MTTFVHSRTGFVSVASLLGLFTLGCGGSLPDNVVSGKITMEMMVKDEEGEEKKVEKPVMMGLVEMMDEKGAIRSGTIRDGQYTISHISEGFKWVAVTSAEPPKRPDFMKIRTKDKDGDKSGPPKDMLKEKDKMSGPDDPMMKGKDKGMNRPMVNPMEMNLDPDKWFKIPDKYSDFEASELVFTIAPGVNTFDIKLK